MTACGDQPCASRVYPGPQGGIIVCEIGPNGGPGGQAGDPMFDNNGSYSIGDHEVRGRPIVPTAETAVGGTSPSGRGQSGVDGHAGAEGTDGANGMWLLTASGFARGNGAAGGAGAPGQGGGGGGSANGWFDPTTGALASLPSGYWICPRGAGGGAGGCAGQPGTPGTGGAASIGALVVASAVTFYNAIIESAAGGRAGKGALGSLGTAGQVFTRADIVFNGITVAGRGGKGGTGGNGGGSGHGAPGPSIALAYAGVRPTLTSTQLMPGSAGAGQPELRQSSPVGDKVVPAAVGVSEAEHHIQ